MDLLLYGIFTLDLVDPVFISNQKFLEVARTPFGLNLGIFGALLLPFLAQSHARSGLICLSMFCLLVMTGLVFSSAVFATCGLVFAAARLLNRWAGKRNGAGLPHLVAWIFVNTLYLPAFFVIYPPFEGFMAPGEIALFWGAGFMVFRSIHYLRLACKGWVDPFEKKAFSRFFLYLVHFPSFWFGPYQKFKQFDSEVSTCKQRINNKNRLAGLRRIGLGLVKFFLIFHINVRYFWNQDFDGPFAEAMFSPLNTMGALELWQFVLLFMLRIMLFISAISDAVIGMNQMMGIRVPENSNWPILARDLQDFWQRWHIQVTVFLREEIFLPVRGLRFRLRGFFLVFAYSGFWHFPSWSAILAFPLLHLTMLEAAFLWRAFWRNHKAQDDWVHRAGLRYKLHNSWLTGALGMVLTVTVNAMSAVFLLDHFYGGTNILPRMFGF